MYGSGVGFGWGMGGCGRSGEGQKAFGDDHEKMCKTR